MDANAGQPFWYLTDRGESQQECTARLVEVFGPVLVNVDDQEQLALTTVLQMFGRSIWAFRHVESAEVDTVAVNNEERLLVILQQYLAHLLSVSPPLAAKSNGRIREAVDAVFESLTADCGQAVLERFRKRVITVGLSSAVEWEGNQLKLKHGGTTTAEIDATGNVE